MQYLLTYTTNCYNNFITCCIVNLVVKTQYLMNMQFMLLNLMVFFCRFLRKAKENGQHEAKGNQECGVKRKKPPGPCVTDQWREKSGRNDVTVSGPPWNLLTHVITSCDTGIALLRYLFRFCSWFIKEQHMGVKTDLN